MIGIIAIVIFPFTLCILYYIKCMTVGNEMDKVNAEINEACVPKPLERKMCGTDLEKQHNILEDYLRDKYPDMYYFSLKDCKIYSPYLTVEVLMKNSDPEVVSFAASDIMKNRIVTITKWNEKMKKQMDEYKKKALEENKVFFVIPWDKNLRNETFREKVIKWYESNTLYRVSSGEDGLIFNYQDEMC